MKARVDKLPSGKRYKFTKNWTAKNVRAEVLADTYGEAVIRPRRRLRGCLCAVPCLSFRCRSRHHRKGASRATPWCCGGAGEGIDHSCSVCAVKEMDRREARAA